MDEILNESKRVLVAEDEKPLARALQLKFGQAGIVVEIAYDGEEALGRIRHESFDVLLLDIMMPKKNGFEVLEAMRAESIAVPTFVLSNLSQPEDKLRAEELGTLGFFVKADVSINLIVERVRQQLAA